MTFHGTETAYRIEEEEEYDPMYSLGLEAMNGAPCYGTRTVRYRVENGENYNFTTLYKTGVKPIEPFMKPRRLPSACLSIVQ